jgi:hypothetical protein
VADVERRTSRVERQTSRVERQASRLDMEFEPKWLLGIIDGAPCTLADVRRAAAGVRCQGSRS